MWRLLLLALSLALPARAQDTKPFGFTLDKFCGIDDSKSSTLISPCHSPDAQNVWTDEGKLETMQGMEELVSQVLANFPVKGIWTFPAPSGTEYIIFHASTTVYYTSLGAAAPTYLSQVDSSEVLDAALGFGKIFFTNAVDGLWYWDETSTAAVSAAPLAEFIEFEDERIYLAKTATSDSQVHVSSFGGFSYWTVPTNVDDQPDAPNSFNFNRQDGCPITCFKATPYGKFVGKKCSSWVLKGFNNETYYKRMVDPLTGCVDDRLVQVLDGKTVFLSREGFREWNGRDAPTIFSDRIQNRARSIRQIFSNSDSFLVNTQAQWQQGTQTPSLSWNTADDPGAIYPSTHVVTHTSESDFTAGTQSNVRVSTSGEVLPAYFEQLVTNGNFETGTDSWTWTPSGSSSQCANGDQLTFSTTTSGPLEGSVSAIITIPGCAPSAGVCNQVIGGLQGLQIQDGAGSAIFSESMVDPGFRTRYGEGNGELSDLQALGTNYMRLAFRFQHTGNSILYSNYFTIADSKNIYVSTAVVNTPSQLCPVGTSKTFRIDFARRDGMHSSSGVFTSSAVDTTYSAPVVSIAASTNVPTGTTLLFQVRTATSSSGTWENWSANISSGSRATGLTKRWVQFKSTFTGTNLIAPALNSFTFLITTTGTYTHPVQNIGSDISAWKNLNATFQELPAGIGRFTLQMRASNTTFADDAASPAWTTIPNNTIPSISVGKFMQHRIINAIAAATETVKALQYTQNWKEGSAPPGASVIFDRRYIACVAVGSNSVVNDSCEIFQKNGEWTRLVGKSVSSLATYDTYPIGGSGLTDSKVWRMWKPDFYVFGSSAINAYWRTADFTFGEPHSDKTIQEVWVDADPSTGTLSVGYDLDRQRTYGTNIVNLAGTSTSTYVNASVNMPDGYGKGRYFSLKLSQNEIEKYFKFNSLSVYGLVEPRYPGRN